MKNLEFTIHGVKFTLASDSPELLAEQQRVLSSNIRLTTEPHIESVDVFYTKNKELFDSLASGFQSHEAIDTFIKEQHYKGEYNGQPAFQKDKQEYFLVPNSQDGFTIVGNPQVDTSAFPIRLMRETLIHKMEERDRVLTHGNGIIVGNEGILITNQSGGGKTTLTTKMFESGEDIGFLSNDKLFCSENNGDPTMGYYPCEMVYAMGTVKGGKKIGEHFRKHKLVERGTKGVFDLDTVSPGKKLELPTSELESIYPNVRLLKTFSVDRVIVPKINLAAESDYVNISKISPGEAEEILADNTLTPVDEDQGRTPWVYPTRRSESDLYSLAGNINRAITQKPAVLVEYGLNADPEDIMSRL